MLSGCITYDPASVNSPGGLTSNWFGLLLEIDVLKRLFGIFLLLTMLLAGAAQAGFTMQDNKGRVHHLEDYRGKWLLVNFWATWCPPCLEEIPDLIKLYDAHKGKDLEILGVAMSYQDPKYVSDFADSMFINYPVVLGTPELAAQIGPVPGLPTSYLFNPQGEIVARQVGGLTKEGVESYIRKNTPAKKAK